MKYLDSIQKEAIESIVKRNEFKVFIQWLESNHVDILDKLLKCQDIIQLHQLQGQGLLLKDLLNVLDSIDKK